ncbi:MAG: helix-turn-helix domain-containing protein [Actinomycetaceae bacterium]|nr:helix-turn-helix domain-containing protein [Actinomycetaceae bacterium]
MARADAPTPFKSTAVTTEHPHVWAKHVASSFVPLEFSTQNTETFSGRMETVPAPRASATLIQAESHTVTRTPELIEDGGESAYKIGLQIKGRATLCQDGREAHLEPGDLVIYDTTRPYLLTYPSEMSSLVLMVSPQSLGLDESEIQHLTAVRLPGDSTLTKLVGPLLGEVAHHPQLFGAATHGRLASNAVDLLATVFRTALDIQVVRRHDDAELMRNRVLHFIRFHIRNPELNAKMIADAHYMSVRSLYALFEESERSIAQIIRAERLEGAMRDLTDPAQLSKPIAGIASTWQFLDAANFSRAFKAHFGMTPRAARALVTG